MNPIPAHPLVKALAVHEERYYSMTPRSDTNNNALMYLGRAREGGAADTTKEDLVRWHKSAFELLQSAPDGAHRILDGATPEEFPRLLGSPWYAVFEYTGQRTTEPGDLWVGRFFQGAAGLAPTTKEGVFVFPDELQAADLDADVVDTPVLNSRKADRSVILAGQDAAGGNTLGSNHGGDLSSTVPRSNW